MSASGHDWTGQSLGWTAANEGGARKRDNPAGMADHPLSHRLNRDKFRVDGRQTGMGLSY
ncbi:hypothetical protein PISMIDRAFT_674954 [Pisolithus microcarpus 441]|uniref:Uncharacterized protein n=1 Tax=Pisolithus microcarpus 441 TaxID=765257 RepID=A0A0C9ZZC7_9AGAM|nr:hypothetical protein PISMIDRAFT_674954 [Pisolithus microcarpus 441]